MVKLSKNDLLHKMMMWIVLVALFAVIAVVVFYLSMVVKHNQQKYQSAQEMLNLQIKLTDAYAWEVESKRYELMEALLELKKAHEKSIVLNSKLEEEVNKRTQALHNQNQKIIEYHFLNAHQLRAPVARIMGLTSLLEKSYLNENDKIILQHLNKATHELDGTVHIIQQKLYCAEYTELLKSA